VLQWLAMPVDPFIVIGAGIAGASAAYELAKIGPVTILERETQPGYHTTGRSAAAFSEIYGNSTIRALTLGSRSFFSSPPDGFAEHPLWSARPTLMVARSDQMERLRLAYDEWVRLVPSVRLLEGADARHSAARRALTKTAAGLSGWRRPVTKRGVNSWPAAASWRPPGKL
jgi:glycine/D-amino acid oxidase-like deaminating enzyme